MKRSLRSVGIVLSIAALVTAYHASINTYLHDLDKPLFLEIGFFVSFAIACSYEFKKANWMYAAVGCLATGLVFVVGTWMATLLRSEYTQMISEIKDNAEIATYVGRDLHEALTNRSVGYGGCLAVGVSLMRLLLDRFARKGLIAMFIPPVERLIPCPCCGQPVVSHAPSPI